MILTIFEIFFIFVLPVILWKFHWFFGKKNPANKLLGFIVFSFTALLITISEHRSLSDLGIRFDNFNASLFPYALFTLTALLGLTLVGRFKKQSKPVLNWSENPWFIFGLIFSSIVQEFVFRSFLMIKLVNLTHSLVIIILLNAFLFALCHIIYDEALWLFVLSFIGGLGYATLYFYFPNLIVISISHMALNFTVSKLGFFKNFSNSAFIIKYGTSGK